MDSPKQSAPLDFPRHILPVFHAASFLQILRGNNELTSHHAGLPSTRHHWDQRPLSGGPWYSDSALFLDAKSMEIGGLLNNRQAVDAQLRQLQNGMQIDNHSYAMGHAQNHLNHQLQDFSSIQQANHGHFSSNYNASAQSIKEDVSLEDADLLAPRKSTNDGHVKKFLCSQETKDGPCPKAFARKSDLARHGRLRLLTMSGLKD